MSFRQRIVRPLKNAIRRAVSGPLRIGRESGEDRFQAGDLTVTCARSLPSEPTTCQAWDDLLRAQPGAMGFAALPWQRGVARFFVAPERLRVVLVHRGGQLLAALPMELAPSGALRSAGSAVSDYIEPLVGHADAEPVWRAILDALRTWWDRSVARIELPNLPEQSPCRAVLSRIAGEAGLAFAEAADGSVLSIPLPHSMEDYYATLTSKDRVELRRRLRKAEAEAAARSSECRDEADFVRTARQTLEFMKARGGEKGESVEHYLEPFLHETALDMFRLKWLRLVALWLNDAPAGGMFVVQAANGPLAYNAGFDLQQRVWGPGIITHLMLLRESIARSDRVYDLLRGQEKYKYAMGAKDRPLYRITLTPAR